LFESSSPNATLKSGAVRDRATFESHLRCSNATTTTNSAANANSSTSTATTAAAAASTTDKY
jgi:hypothetical protein